MSSFLKSAAMTILSRMIQALLSKYIVDVDVEGIAFPSMISTFSSTITSTDSTTNNANAFTTTGSNSYNNNNNNNNNNMNSGFGMHLSNVKLRNGAKLFELPGKLPHHQNSEKQEKQQQQVPKEHQPRQQQEINTESNQQQQHQQQQRSIPFPAATTVELQELVLYDVENSFDYHQSSTTTPLLSHQNYNQTNNKSTKKKVSWMSSWFSSSTSNTNDDTTTATAIDNNEKDNVTTGSTNTKQHIEVESNNMLIDVSVNDCENGSPMWMKQSSTTTKTTQGRLNSNSTTNSSQTPNNNQTPEQLDNSNLNQNQDNNVDKNSTMNLQLGNDCIIGTLDVRRIGKTIHVLVEDLSLNLDVVQIQNDSIDTTKNTTTNDNNSNKKTKSTPMDKAGANRVLAENAIARFFALLPNLFIRNARIRLTIRDNNDNEGNESQAATEQVSRSNDIGIVEITIDNLTITDGEDFVSKLRSKNNEQSTDDNDKDVENEEYDDENDNDNNNNRNTKTDVVGDDDNNDNGNDSDSDESGPKGTKSSISAATMSSFYTDESNDFITRRIRTGTSRSCGMNRKSNHGGKYDDSTITIRVYPPTSMHSTNYISHRIHRLSKVSNHQSQSQQSQQRQWARDSFLSESGNVLLRCTGLDVQAQIFVGTKRKQQQHREMILSNSTISLPYNDAILDSMISGCVDYVVPGPNSTTPTTLPPMFQNNDTMILSESDSKEFQDSYTDPGMFDDGGALPNLYNTDTNGIQSCRIPSIFHKVSRGFVPDSSNPHCLPCEDNAVSWINPGSDNDFHHLDASIPLAGLALHISIKDNLEVNADRQTLETVGIILSLFQKKDDIDDSLSNTIDSNTNSQNVQKKDDYNDDVGDDDRSEASAGSARTEMSLFCKSPTRESIVVRHDDVDDNNVHESNERNDSDTGFPSYMQPEKIQILGVYISKANLRLHCMKDLSTNTTNEVKQKYNYDNESGISFCYWHANASCLTMDVQSMNAIERPFQDIRLDCAYLKVVEYKGLNERLLLDTTTNDDCDWNGGIQRCPSNADTCKLKSFDSSDRNISNDNNARSPWPSTAAALMDIPPLFESIKYESRTNHTIQCRFVNINDTSILLKDIVRRNLIVNICNVNVDAPFPIWRQIPELINEIRISVFGKPILSPTAKRLDSRLKFSIRSYSGQIHLEPLINATVPIPIIVNGEYSTTSGMSFQTSIDDTKISYGIGTKAPILESNLTIQQLAALPEIVRVRILLFIQDLTPLEVALGIDSSSNNVSMNPYRRQQNVNHAIVQLAKNCTFPNMLIGDNNNKNNSAERNQQHQQQQQQHSLSNGTYSMSQRRQFLLSRLGKLDDDTLEYMLSQSTKLV